MLRYLICFKISRVCFEVNEISKYATHSLVCPTYVLRIFLDVKIYISDRMSLYWCRPLNPLIRYRLISSCFYMTAPNVSDRVFIFQFCVYLLFLQLIDAVSQRDHLEERSQHVTQVEITCVLNSKETCVRVSEAVSVDASPGGNVRAICSSPTSYLCLLSCSQWSYFMASRLCSHSHSSLAFSLEERNHTVSEASLGGAPQQRSTRRWLDWRLSIVLTLNPCFYPETHKQKLLAV